MPAINAEEFLTQAQFGIPAPVAQDSVVPDLHEPIGEDVQEKAPDELRSIQSHGLDPVVVLAIPVSEGNLAALQLYQPVVRYSHPMGVPTKVIHHQLCPLERGFAVDHPLLSVEFFEQDVECTLLSQVGNIAREHQLPFPISFLEVGQELASEEPRENLDGKEKLSLAGYPSQPIRGQPTSCYDAMQMWMIHEGLAPGMQDCNEAHLRSKVLGIFRQFLDALRYGPKKDGVDHLLVSQGERL
jgi:hypothetical protein